MLGSRAFKIAGSVLLVANITFFAASLVVRDPSGTSRLWDLWGPTYVLAGPTLACFARAILGGTRRSGAACLGVAMLSFAVGSVVFVGWTQFQADPPVPSAADLAYLAFYPCAAAAVLLLLRGDESSSDRGMWLDASLGAAGSATALAAVLSPVFDRTGGELAAVVVGAAFSVADLLLIALICGVMAARGLQGGSMWMWLAIGLALFCAADVQYALRVASGTYVVGTLWSVLWALGMTVAAFAVWRPERPRRLGEGRSAAILVIPMVAVTTAVVVLVVSSINRLPAVVIALATFTLILAAVRTFVGFQQVRRLSDAHRQAVTDELTGLGNRRALFERGGQRLASSGATDGVMLMLIDLNDFKSVNDSLGHQAGDELLRETARRLAARIRHPELLVRLGGDEFALVFEPPAGEDGRATAERILDRVREPFLIEGARLRVDASAGLAESRGSEITVSELLRRADVAMYAAKAIGSPVERYDPQLDEDNRARLETIQDLDAAIVHDQFVLHYQPKIDVATGAVIGAEALVRWEHPTRGLIYPDAFLPLVEQSGLMGAVTRLVLEAAIEQIAACRATGLDIDVAVNLSASDLLDGHLPELILARLSEHAVPVEALELEITESVLMTDPVRAREMLERLRQLGLRIAVDDYGTGYCALAYLRDLPIDELKIDRSFIACVTADPRSAAIVRSTIELAHALDLEVVAEGVEHHEALAMLGTFGCDSAQGYHFSRPLPAADFVDWARARTHSITPRRVTLR